MRFGMPIRIMYFFGLSSLSYRPPQDYLTLGLCGLFLVIIIDTSTQQAPAGSHDSARFARACHTRQRRAAICDTQGTLPSPRPQHVSLFLQLLMPANVSLSSRRVILRDSDAGTAHYTRHYLCNSACALEWWEDYLPPNLLVHITNCHNKAYTVGLLLLLGRDHKLLLRVQVLRGVFQSHTKADPYLYQPYVSTHQ